MHCNNNHGQQNFPGLNHEREQPHLSNGRDTGEAIEIGDIQLPIYTDSNYWKVQHVLAKRGIRLPTT